MCERKSEKMGNHFDASIYMLTKHEGGRTKPILSKYTQVLFSRTWSIPCRVDLCKCNEKRQVISALKEFESINNNYSNVSIFWKIVKGKQLVIPGEQADVRLTILKKMVMSVGQSFTIREGNVTVATGIVTKEQPSVEFPMNKMSKVEIKE